MIDHFVIFCFEKSSKWCIILSKSDCSSRWSESGRSSLVPLSWSRDLNLDRKLDSKYSRNFSLILLSGEVFRSPLTWDATVCGTWKALWPRRVSEAWFRIRSQTVINHFLTGNSRHSINLGTHPGFVALYHCGEILAGRFDGATFRKNIVSEH